MHIILSTACTCFCFPGIPLCLPPPSSFFPSPPPPSSPLSRLTRVPLPHDLTSRHNQYFSYPLLFPFPPCPTCLPFFPCHTHFSSPCSTHLPPLPLQQLPAPPAARLFLPNCYPHFLSLTALTFLLHSPSPISPLLPPSLTLPLLPFSITHFPSPPSLTFLLHPLPLSSFPQHSPSSSLLLHLLSLPPNPLPSRPYPHPLLLCPLLPTTFIPCSSPSLSSLSLCLSLPCPSSPPSSSPSAPPYRPCLPFSPDRLSSPAGSLSTWASDLGRAGQTGKSIHKN